MSRCPARPVCRTPVEPNQIACKVHWFSLPRALRRRIWVLNQREKGSERHLAAIKEAVKLLMGVGEPTR